MDRSIDAEAWRRHYDNGEVVAEYARESALQPPEAAIVAEIGPALREARLLDIGVGAGRTTRHLAPLCREYVGIDYAASMIAACRKTFEPLLRAGRARFELADARALPFSDAAFEAVMFSFNGIDYVPAAQRTQVLRECRRVLTAGGVFVFSTHNLEWLASLRHVRFRGSLTRLVEEARFWAGMRSLNRAAWPIDDRDALALREPGSDGFLTFYDRPKCTVAALEEAGFTGVRFFDLAGREAGVEAAGRLTDPWLYVLCRAA